MQIGIGITTKNRREVATECINKIIKRSNGAKIVIIDDGSDEPYPNATVRYEKSVGIARAKNKCIELLEDCDYIFLFDDDIYPLVDDWQERYINTGENHLCYTWLKYKGDTANNNIFLGTHNGLNVYYYGNGCMIFLTKKVIETVGGFDSKFKGYGYEHGEYSTRICNAGLTAFNFMDLQDSNDIFYSLDYTREVKTSTPEKKKYLHNNEVLKRKEQDSKEYKKYKNMDAVFTCYLTGAVDPQRGEVWEADLTKVYDLIESCKFHDVELVLFHDCFQLEQLDGVRLVRVAQSNENPYLRRWKLYQSYVSKYDNVFCVDATDVIMQINPFPEMKHGVVYVGDELDYLSSQWLVKHHSTPFLRDFLRLHRKKQLLNAGIVGGSRDVLDKFLRRMIEIMESEDIGSTDMALLNYVAYNEFNGNIEHGQQVNTVFKMYERNKFSWFKHK